MIFNKILIFVLGVAFGCIVGYEIPITAKESVAIKGCETIAFEVERELRQCEHTLDYCRIKRLKCFEALNDALKQKETSKCSTEWCLPKNN
jgi:hypothetical protein